ncbi:ATP-binding cassette domain-containing protein [Citroniella saccharovorans]|uniref:ATP-binding cassette domain-containing protein n=2 Tax=Citroniella saccharovorans TaxID=2053367 RepID=A0AAW9MWF0_9FIRM|nr:ATP-binding cassette domain-containing protein [Citroniella saccharovorans]MEB3429253.1 ATP-binding cassette domain-containing protein [Citroniella saccharovorans]
MNGAILTQNTAGTNAEKAIGQFEDDMTPERIHHLPLEKLQDLIRQSGIYKQKLQYLKVLTEWFMSYDCDVKRIQNLPLSDVRKDLLGVHGVGNETADSVLLYAFHFPTFVVDAYTMRLFKRYPLDAGKILIDGKDIKEISTESLFDKVSIVFQNVVFFNQSVMENIRLGKQDASDEKVKRAAELANCMDFIENMPNGYDTVIGENGAELSGGERQRLSIARAFLKNAPILILDEIAASLDVENEKKIQESLNNLMKDKTVVIISHRMKSIENADKIIVLENGKVESEGKHRELLQKSKVYKNLIEKTKIAEEFIY